MSDSDEILKQSGPLPIPRKVVEAASSVQAQLLIMVNGVMTRLDNQDQAKILADDAMFKKMDEAAGLARTAVSTAEASHAETMGIKAQIEAEFIRLNGSLGKAVDRLGKLEAKDGERDVEALKDAVASNAVTVATKGIWMIPKPDAITISTALGSVTGVISLIASGQLKQFFEWIATHV